MITSPRIPNRDIPTYVARRVDFAANSAQGIAIPAGVSGRYVSPTGYLPEAWRDLLSSQTVDYVVWSYRTPIAWVTTDGRHVIPDVKYSQTTSRHQTLVRSALTGPGIRSASDIPASVTR